MPCTRTGRPVRFIPAGDGHVSQIYALMRVAMRKPAGIFFAPSFRFRDLNLKDGKALSYALNERTSEWFLEPARSVGKSSPFAAGIIVTSFIEAAARYEQVCPVVWLHQALPSSAARDPRRTGKSVAESFVEDVRNGLVHHNRLNRGAEFTLESDEALLVTERVLIVNPLSLLDAVQERWKKTLVEIESDPNVCERVAKEISRVFRADFEADERWEREIVGG